MAGPTNQEQELLELINEARLYPVANANRYISSYSPLTSTNADVQNALTFFGVNGTALRSAIAALPPVAPVAWNEALGGAARLHNTKMIAANQQTHQAPGEADLGARITAAGYNWSNLGENVYAFSTSALHAHAGFMVDWGGGPNGMQSPAGHRLNIMNSGFREVGVGITAENNGATQIGPLLVTEDFGARFGAGALVFGVAYRDTNVSGIYNAGEAAAALTARIGATQVTSWASGGYTLETAATGAQTVLFNGGGLASQLSVTVALTASSNVKLDIVNGNMLKTSVSATVSGPVTTIAGLGVTGLTLTALGTGGQTFIGTIAADTFIGGDGNDLYNVSIGDRVTETTTGGIDSILSNTISLNLSSFANVENIILLGAAALNATGNGSNNAVIGNNGVNVLNGQGGNDTLIGAAGIDTLTGSTGRDIFVFNAAPNASTNVDTITDFVVVDDTIMLENSIFTAFASAAVGSTLVAAAFKANAAGVATDADDRIIYKTGTGQLFYDVDGNTPGGAAAVQFATLTGLPAISNFDFVIL